MLKSKLWIGVIGLATFILAPQQLSYGETVSEFMEVNMQTRTKETEQKNTNEIKLQDDIEFISIHQESAKGEVEVIEEETYKKIDCELTFYTNLPSCTGSTHGLTASGVELNPMTVAVSRKQNSKKPVFPFGTKIYIEGIGERIVQDTGNPKYLKIKEDGTYILDVYVPRNSGEDNEAYHARVLAKGRVTTTAKVYLEEE